MTRLTLAQAMVEFAIVGSAFFVLLYGVFELGRLMFEYSSVANAAREGARTGAIAGRNDATVTARVREVIIAPGATAVVQISNYSVDSATPVANQTPVAFSTATPRAAGDLIKVTVSYPYAPVAFIKLPGTLTLTSSAEMVVE
ncbi:MAG TPA: TadE/TadG family type IV pilus assembly protein [Chloroflexota bacterium]|nr:TadE/TadG family type IV pilus assembly protein [Chloroflexota bacterium]